MVVDATAIFKKKQVDTVRAAYQKTLAFDTAERFPRMSAKQVQQLNGDVLKAIFTGASKK